MKLLLKVLKMRNTLETRSFGIKLKTNTMVNKEKDIKEFSKKLARGLEMSYERLVAFKRYKKSPLVVFKDGEVIEIPPEEIPPTTKYRNRSTEKTS